MLEAVDGTLPSMRIWAAYPSTVSHLHLIRDKLLNLVALSVDGSYIRNQPYAHKALWQIHFASLTSLYVQNFPPGLNLSRISSSRFPCLTHLSLVQCSLNDHSCNILALSSTQLPLMYLNLSYNPELTEFGLLLLAHSALQVKTIAICCTGVDNNRFIYLLCQRTCFPSLCTLHLSANATQAPWLEQQLLSVTRNIAIKTHV